MANSSKQNKDKFTDITPLGLNKSVDLEKFIVTDFFQPPLLSVDWHAHEKLTLLFVFTGGVEEKFKRKTFQCSFSSVLVRPAEELHSHSYSSVGANCLAIQVKSDYLQKNKEILQKIDSILFSQTSSLISAARKIKYEIQIMDEASPIAIESYFLEIVAKLIRADKKSRNSPPPIWLKRAWDLVNDSFKESLNLSKIAEEVGIHPTYLTEMFRKHFGITLGEYVRNLRLDFTFQQITETGKSLTEIALEAGFYDQSHFTRRFKEKFNATPLEIRQMTKKTNLIPKS